VTVPFIWQWEEINEMLPLVDAVICNLLTPTGAQVLEVGTWKGGWALSMAENDRSRKLICIDPYPNYSEMKDEFLRIADMRAPGQILLYPSMSSIENFKSLKLDVIHIDGEHSQEATYSDISEALPRLVDTGLIIIDDVFYHDFPGVSAAAFKALEEFKLSPFLFSEKKLYACYPTFYEVYYSKCKAILEELNIKYQEDEFLTGKFGQYMQRNAINGFSLLIISSDLTKNFLRTLGIKCKFSLKSAVISVIPPIFFNLLQALYRTIKYKV